MKAAVAGVLFDVEPAEAFSAEEIALLQRLAPVEEDGPLFRLKVADGDPPRADMEYGAPAAVDSADGRTVDVSHRSFTARLDPWNLEGLLRRPRGASFPLEITLRVAMAARLPLCGGLPLHAAGLAVDGRGVAFFGPSGAGKSTLSSLSPHPVLSDELVAILGGADFALAPSGFWGTFAGHSPAKSFPLALLVELGKGPSRWEPLSPEMALRRLIPVIMVPPAAELWSAALVVLNDLLRRIPVFRMDWEPESPPWAEIADRIRAANAPLRV